MSALDYFSLFYSEELFTKIVEYTNRNAEKNRREDPEHNRGERQPVTMEELKALYGVTLMVDIIRIDRDALYWDTGAKYFMLGTNISKVMSRNRFFQLRRYLSTCIHFFTDPNLPADAGDTLDKIRRVIDTVRAAFMREFIHQLVGTVHLERQPAGRPRAKNDDSRLDRIHGSLASNRCGLRPRVCRVVCNARHQRHRVSHPGTSFSDNPHKRRKTAMKCEKCDAYTVLQSPEKLFQSISLSVSHLGFKTTVTVDYLSGDSGDRRQ